MKRIFALWLAVLFACSMLVGCNEVTVPNNATVPTEKPAVEPSTITLHLITEYRAGRVGEPLSCKTRATYDERGLTQTLIHEDFTLPKQSYHYEYHYNEHGHLLYTSTMENGQEIAKSTPYEYRYNPDGTIASIENYFEEGFCFRFEYDEQGRQVKASTNYFGEEFWDYALCQYDQAGRLEKYTIQIPKTEVTLSASTSTTSFHYNDQGRLTSIDESYLYNCEYDMFGNLIRENSYYYTYSGPSGVMTNVQNIDAPEEKYEFDELGRLVRMVSDDYVKEWEYQTIEIPIENLNMSILFYSHTNEIPRMATYYDKIQNYLLPHPHSI